MDPVSLAFIASLAAAAAVAELARPKTREEEFHRAWGEAMSNRRRRAVEDLRELVRLDERQAQGLPPEGYTWLPDGRILPTRAYFYYVNAAPDEDGELVVGMHTGTPAVSLTGQSLGSLDGPVDVGLIEGDVQEWIEKVALADYGRWSEIWVRQISGYDATGDNFVTVLLEQPLKVRTGRAQIFIRDDLTSGDGERFDALVEIEILDLLEPPPPELLPLLGPRTDSDLQRPLFATGLQILGDTQDTDDFWDED